MSLLAPHPDGDVQLLLLPSPILSAELLEALANALHDAATTAQPLVVASSHPTVFLAGAHLAEIAALDAAASEPYARRGRDVLGLLARHPAPVVAAVHGPCLGGGVDLVLECDAVVAGPDAQFGHPGVRRGLVTGWGGTARWPGHLGRPAARHAFLTGDGVTAERACALGWVTTVATVPATAAATEARRLARIHPARLALWRTLRRGRFVDRFRALVVHNSRM